MTHYDPNDFDDEADDFAPSAVSVWAVVLTLAFIALLLVAFWPSLSKAGTVVITDQDGVLVRTCVSPVELVLAQGAIVCRAPETIFHDGYES